MQGYSKHEAELIYRLVSADVLGDFSNIILIKHYKLLWLRGSSLVNTDNEELPLCLKAIKNIGAILLSRGFDPELYRDEVGSYLYSISRGI